ncbi:Clathrin adaptor mu subunit, related [Eimeria acervulina]|uniref:Clathrin adaptor mu subunit, related n=1 Tax=Eimeria acervulina TaxID=5801 RepID=U6GIA7_EIMAC|nr:Clathrin adaptor mu subunit, related [Eimeria acervulina]CDI78319.1 Clathrin adaptor mu subunit, related [Eimeria acervulina]
MLRRLLQLLQACASRAAPSTSLGALCLRKTAAGGGPLLSEAFILQSSDLVYEILDEAIDRGVPQTSDPKVLLLFAEAAANLRSTGGASAAAANSSEGGVKLAAQATGVAAWRRQGIRYRRNQLSIEVIEKLHILIAQNGTVLRQEAEGKVLLRSFLSGMPECKLITNEVLPQSDRQHLADDTQIQAITNAPLKGAAAQAAKTHTATGPPSPAAAPAAASSSAASTSAPAAAPAAAPGAPGSSVVAQRVITEGAEGPLPVGAKERVKLSGCRYHPCVRVAQHTAERMILFTPPDGECELMSYRQVANNIPFLLSAAASAAAASAGASAAADLLCKDDVAVPIKVCPFFYEKKKGQFEYLVFLKALYSGNLTARDIEVVVPTPPEVSVVCVLQSSWGKSKYDSSQLAVVWKLARFPGGCEYVLRFLLEVSKPPSPVRGPLRLSFSLPGLTASGLCIRQLRVVEKSNYSVSKSIRYLTESGQFPGGCEYVLRFLLEVSKPPSPVRGPLRLSFSLPGLTASGLCIRQLRVVEKSNYSVSKSIRYLTESGQYEHRL